MHLHNVTAKYISVASAAPAIHLSIHPPIRPSSSSPSPVKLCELHLKADHSPFGVANASALSYYLSFEGQQIWLDQSSTVHNGGQLNALGNDARAPTVFSLQKAIRWTINDANK